VLLLSLTIQLLTSDALGMAVVEDVVTAGAGRDCDLIAVLKM